MKHAIPTDAQLAALDRVWAAVQAVGRQGCSICEELLDDEEAATVISLAHAQLTVMRDTLNGIEEAIGPEQMSRYGACHLSAVKDYIARARPLEVSK